MDLTKNLYFQNDVKWALFVSLLNKNEEQTIFWLCEYYESGYKNETWKLIYVFYNCYYSKYYVNFKKNIDRHYKKWLNNNKVEYILKIVFHMFKLKNKDDEFYKLFSSKVKKIEKLKTQIDDKIISELELRTNIRMKKKYKEFIKSLTENHIENIWAYIIVLDFEKCKKLTKVYFEIHDKKIENTVYPDVNSKKVQLFLEIYINNNEIKRKKKILVKLNNEVKNKYEEFLTIKKYTKTIDILKEKRVFQIPEDIMQFDCFRKKFTIEEMKIMYLEDWLYYCKNTPYWKEIFSKYKINFDENKEPVFENDTIEDEFCQQYYLDPDEQPIFVQKKSNFTLK